MGHQVDRAGVHIAVAIPHNPVEVDVLGSEPCRGLELRMEKREDTWDSMPLWMDL